MKNASPKIVLVTRVRIFEPPLAFRRNQGGGRLLPSLRQHMLQMEEQTNTGAEIARRQGPGVTWADEKES